MLSSFIVVLALLSGSLASPVKLATYHPASGTKVPDTYIINLKPGVSKASHLAWLKSHFGNSTTLKYTNWSDKVFRGFSAKLTPEVVEKLRSSPDVESITEDGVARAFETIVQTTAPWGLSRISKTGKVGSSNTSALTYTYRYDSAGGLGVDVYVVDTGININHVEFGGRARLGAVFGSSNNVDGNGHGTHCSGTIAGTTYGVAKQANVIAVKVLSDGGSGSWSDVISGINFVGTSAAASGRPSVISMSLGGGAVDAVDAAVNAVIDSGVHVVVAAGNSNTDAKTTSPARVPAAITVGATSIDDARASFSNYGAIVDIFAPGVEVISAWIGSNTATNSISGTSMATPHVAGLVAYLISVEGNKTPAEIITRIRALSETGVISGIPTSTINALARNGVAA